MTRDDIIRMARESGLEAYSILPHKEIDWDCLVDDLATFAHLIYEATFRDANIAASRTILDAAVLEEREACAQIADAHASIEGIAQRIAAEIRGRQR